LAVIYRDDKREMTKYKKEFPLSVLQTIEELIKTESPHFEVTNSGESLLKFRDKDSKSDFYFEIKSYKFDSNNKLQLEISYKPRHRDIPTTHEKTVDTKTLGVSLRTWSDLLSGYEQIKIFDDPILKQYEDEFLTEFEILDADADTNSYDFKTQILIDNYLDYCSVKLSEHKTEENKKEVEIIENEIKDLKANQTQLTKRKVVQRLARIWSKTRKFGLNLLKDVYQEAKKEIIKQLIKGQIDLM
jgi:hypothetical protein